MKSINISTNKLTRLALTPLILLLLCVVGMRSAYLAPQASAIRLDIATVDAATGSAKSNFFLGETIAVVFSLTNQSGSPQVVSVPEQVEIQVTLSGTLARSDSVQVREGVLGGNSGSYENPDGSVFLTELPRRTLTLAPGQRMDVRINDLFRFNAARIDDGAYTLTGTYGGTQQAQATFTVAIDAPRTVPVLQQLTNSTDDADKKWANAYLDLINKASISGRITDPSGAPVSGITIYVTGSETSHIDTGADGKYDLIQMTTGGTFTLTPSRDGYTFQPASRTFSNLTGKPADMNFTATRVGAGVNVATDATVTASSQDPDYPAENVIDGSTSGSGWGLGSGGWQDATPGAFPDWIEVNFGATKAIDWINVYTLQDNYSNPAEPTLTQTFSQFGITDFDVQYWNGSAFVNVPGGAVNGNNNVWRNVTFPTLSTSRIRVFVRNGLAGQSRITEIQAFHQNVPPTVSITGTYQGAPGVTFQFASNAADIDGTISRYDWDLGDGTTATGANPSHTYPTAGTFTAALVVTDDGGETARATKTVTITALPQPPTASAGGPYNGFAGSPVVFEGRASFDPDGSITTYQWNFGDSTSGTGATPSHTYAQAGTYSVTLVVTDNSGSTASANATANIAASPASVVNMTAPANGTVVAAGSTVRLIAGVSSQDPISSVQFFQGTTLLGNGTLVTPAATPPSYFFDWANVPAGNYVVTAQATSTSGTVGTSAPVNLTVSAPPTVTITAPANNATFSAPASITVSANAAASTGSVSNVEFFQGSTKIGEDNTAPYSVAWNSVAAGSYQLTAKVTDSNNFTATSTVVTVIVNAPPTVSITSPTNGQSFNAGANISISAAAADADGTIAKVEFYSGATLIGTATAAPFTVNWSNVPAGHYGLTAKAADNRGAATTSAPVNVIVNAPPTVGLISPTNNSTFTSGSTIQIAASASDSDGTINKVEIYQGATLLGQAAPGLSLFYFNWNGVPSGTYSVTARATDDLGFTTTSTAITLTVGPPVHSGYTYKRIVTIDHTKVPNTDQSNFPVLISGTYPYLASTANGGDVQNANGYDVIFTSDAGCATPLNHEVETYNAVSGAVSYWVQVPTVSHTTDTVFYMCYGKPGITSDQSNKAAVWDANYKAVWHVADGTNLNVTDSTANHNLTNNGATATTGKVDGGANFNGSSQYLSSAQHTDFNWTNMRTVEFWMKLGNTSQTLPRLFSQSDGSAAGWSVSWLDPASGAGVGWAGKFLVVSIGTQATPSIQKQTPDNGPINSTDTWHQVAVIGDGTTVAAIYVDGDPVTVSNYSGNITNTTVAGLDIGRRNNNGRYYAGGLDELRLSNSQRSADWIKTEYNNQSSPSSFYAISFGQ